MGTWWLSGRGHASAGRKGALLSAFTTRPLEPWARHGLSTSPTRGHQQGVWNLIFPGYILILNKIPLAVYHFKN